MGVRSSIAWAAVVMALVLVLVTIVALFVSTYNSGKHWPLDGMVLRAGDLGAEWTDDGVRYEAPELGATDKVSTRLEQEPRGGDPEHTSMSISLLRFNSSEGAAAAYQATLSTKKGEPSNWTLPYEGMAFRQGNESDRSYDVIFLKRDFVCFMQIVHVSTSVQDCDCEMERLVREQWAQIQ